MSTLYITRGLPAAGKTTWAKTWVAAEPASRARVNRDDFRSMLYETPDYSWPQESAVTEASRSAVRALLAAGRDVVADDMNLRPKYVREWARFAAANGAGLEVVEFPISVEESVDRDALRTRQVTEPVIRRMAQKYLQKGQLQPIPEEALNDDTPAGDMRKDSIVKRELFDAHIRDVYDVHYVLDDRQQVVDMWRGLGLAVFQVAPGDF